MADASDIHRLIERITGPVVNNYRLDTAEAFCKENLDLLIKWHKEVALAEAIELFNKHLDSVGSEQRYGNPFVGEQLP